MSDPITLPSFYDGQIIKADDLDASVEYGRDQLARHERGAHSWGVMTGLDLQASPGTGAVEVTVEPGVAVDALGRELVLSAARLLDETDFLNSSVVDPSDAPDAWYPVYVSGVSSPQAAASQVGGCAPAGNGTTTRLVEDVQFSFGRPDAPKSPDPAVSVDPADGPDAPAGSAAPTVLIGFIQWDPNAHQFTAAGADNTQGIDRRTAGVRADRVEARDGVLVLQTSDSGSSKGGKKLLVRLEEGDPSAKPKPTPGLLIFGPDDGQGQVTRVFTVSETGDLTVQGSISSTDISGKVLMQSGLTTDGVILPLPTGLTEDAVSQSGIALHIQVTPLAFVPNPPGLDGNWAAIPIQCAVDDDRRVSCVMRWISPNTTSATKFVDLPAACNYLIVASVPPAKGSTP